eukprot:1583716-Rhodomonas_salina.3
MELGLAAKRPPGDYWDEEENDYLTQPGDARYRLRACYHAPKSIGRARLSRAICTRKAGFCV